MTSTNQTADVPHVLRASELAQMIDISAVQAFHTEADVQAVARSAREGGFIAAHALPHFMPLLRRLIPADGPTRVGGPVGFPSGGHASATKVVEARTLVSEGAEELDMMINVGRLKSGHLQYVTDEIRAVVEAITPVPLKVILEISYLTDDEIRRGCDCVIAAGAAFVKTATGWTPPGTTVERVALICDAVRGRVQVKASGGIRDLQTIAAMIDLGVSRFGINTQVALDLVQQCEALPQGGLQIASSRADA
ncbi:deoxyribose-phosphate aldolase [Paraburkholderia sp. GAS199]|uniref:deoxyribose-phosphate aldolase n=1 Tax=Paraburkholderia sp. GAS199 TaxID=3035126 RepID=UPI003D1EC20C